VTENEEHKNEHASSEEELDEMETTGGEEDCDDDRDVKTLYRVTVDIIFEADDDGDAERKVTEEMYNCDFAEVSIDSVYED